MTNDVTQASIVGEVIANSLLQTMTLGFNPKLVKALIRTKMQTLTGDEPSMHQVNKYFDMTLAELPQVPIAFVEAVYHVTKVSLYAFAYKAGVPFSTLAFSVLRTEKDKEAKTDTKLAG